jgi:menaquinone-specific isochorismate synthase
VTAPEAPAGAAPREADVRAPDAMRALDAALVRARQVPGLSAIALPAPVVAAPVAVATWPEAPAVAWSSRELTLVGVGIARELRAEGAGRWHALADAARALGPCRCDLVDPTALPTPLARPRLLGGLAFAPGAAARAPWTGFGDAWFVLPRWTYVHDGAHAYLVLAVDERDAHDAARWQAELARWQLGLAAPEAAPRRPAVLELDPGDLDVWRAQVRAITTAIAGGTCEKIAAARRAIVRLAGDARPADVLAELDARHAECVRLLVRPPDGGALVAATPERLVRVDGRRVTCDALAGSIAAGGDRAAEALLDSGKDRREHAIVVDAIVEGLRELGAMVELPDAPRIRALRHILHLHTPIAATLPARRHVLEVAARLHPTPAVGGTPAATAAAWIAENEPVPRGWYAAPVGWFDLDGDGEFAVAIRSGVLAGDRAHLWVGAGIVAGSDPDRELAETEVKLRAMLGALGGGA